MLVEFRCAGELITAIKAELEGYDAIVVGHFPDAGSHDVRSIADMPVTGLGEATMLWCCQLALRLGIVTINPRSAPWFHQQIGKYGLRGRGGRIYSVRFEPGQIPGAYGGEGGAIETKDLFDKQAEALVAQGIEGPPYEADRDASSIINSHPASP